VKQCRRCKTTKPRAAFTKDARSTDGLQGTCRECCSARRAEQRSPEKNFKANLKAQYGMTVEEYDSLDAAQGGMCAICGRKDSGRAGTSRLSVDHDHKSGQVRGLLCHYCNTAIGAFQDSPELLASAILYLERPK